MISKLTLAAIATLPLVGCGSSIQLGDTMPNPSDATFEYLTVYKYELYRTDTDEGAIAHLAAALTDPGSPDSKNIVQDALNELGDEGWEMVTVLDEQVVFKRRKSSD